MKTTDKLAIAKEIIKENFEYGCHGLFNTPNWVGDEMDVLYDVNGLEVSICYPYSYFEVFGLSEKEFIELNKFYKTILEFDNEVRNDTRRTCNVDTNIWSSRRKSKGNSRKNNGTEEQLADLGDGGCASDTMQEHQ